MLKPLRKTTSALLSYFKYLNDSDKKLIFVILLACIGFIPTIFLPHIGEEGVYTIGSWEMQYYKNFWQVTLYGGMYPRPPLFNWCILGVAYLLRLQDLLIAARVVSILSTLGTAALVIWLAQRLWQQRLIGILCCGIFLSGDILFLRGWLAYSDPIFSLCIFASIALLWLAVHEQNFLWLTLSIIGLMLGYLAKVHTNYIFYGVMWLVLFWRYPQQRKFLINYRAIFLYLLAAAFPILWIKYFGHSGKIASTISDILHAWQIDSLPKYLLKVLLYPLEIVVRALPISIVIFYYLFVKRQKILLDEICYIAIIVCVVNFVPYWFSPNSCIRYFLPLYPLMAMPLAYIVYNKRELLLQPIINWLTLFVFINYLIISFWYPYNQTIRKGNAKVIASDILSIVQEQPLYINNSGSGGLRITAELNKMRIGKPPLRYAEENYCGYAIVNKSTYLPGKHVATYKLGGIIVDLICNGECCNSDKLMNDRD